jgi:hypothetical protein
MTARQAERSNMSEMFTKEDILSSFGITPPAAEDEASDDTQEETPPEDQEENAEESQDESEETEEEGEETPPEDKKKETERKDPLEGLKTKDAAAFAQMRIQNTKQQEVLKNVAGLLGLDVKSTESPEAIVDAVKRVITAAQAKERGMVPEDLEELNTLKAARAEYESKTRYITAQESLINIQDEFKIPDEALKGFVAELVEANLNPLEMDVDIRKEYLSRHIQDIMAQSKQAAIEATTKRKQKNESAPGMPPGKGKSQPGPKRITTVAGLDTFLNNIEL